METSELTVGKSLVFLVKVLELVLDGYRCTDAITERVCNVFDKLEFRGTYLSSPLSVIDFILSVLYRFL